MIRNSEPTTNRITGVRYPCDGFAAFLARLLAFADSPFVKVEAGALYVQITEALAYRFAHRLLLLSTYAARMSREEAAERYWEATIARRLLLTGRVQLSVSHKLLEALCRRGADSQWSTAVLGRERQSATRDVSDALTPVSFAACARRLSQLPAGLSRGSASASIRERDGPLVLRMGDHSSTVAEELSLWDAISCGPDELHALPRGERFNKFCGTVIDCMRTAHRPFMELVRLGRRLCPFDWLDVLTIQQTRHLVQFLSAVRGRDTPSTWELAWQHARVPGFASAAELWGSDIGVALRHAVVTDGPAAADITGPADDQLEDAEPELLSEQEFLQQLDLLRQDHLIDDIERRLLIELYAGADRHELLSVPGVKAALRLRALTLDALLDDLERRISAWQRSNMRVLPS